MRRNKLHRVRREGRGVCFLCAKFCALTTLEYEYRKYPPLSPSLSPSISYLFHARPKQGKQDHLGVDLYDLPGLHNLISLLLFHVTACTGRTKTTRVHYEALHQSELVLFFFVTGNTISKLEEAVGRFGD